jgi:hypothetical protein
MEPRNQEPAVLQRALDAAKRAADSDGNHPSMADQAARTIC